MKAKINPLLFGALGLLAMIAFYYILLAATTGNLLHPFYFFIEKWYFLVLLFLGFGLQMFLFQKLRIVVHKNSLKMAGASAGASSVAMTACCAHHLADVFPLLGLAGAAAAVSEYQDLFLGLGVAMNIIGVIYMWLKLRKQAKMMCCQN
jgi:hypothetical protein